MDAKQLVNAGLACLQRGDFPQAEAHLRAALSARPRDAQIALLLAEAVARCHGPEAAIPALQQAARAAPKLDEPLSRLGWIHLQLRRPAEARKFFQKALLLSPKRLDCLVGQAKAAAAVHDTRAAIEAVRKALAVKPDGPELWAMLGSLLSDANEMEEAARCFEREFQITGHPAMALQAQSCIPSIAADTAEIAAHRARLRDGLARAMAAPWSMDDPLRLGFGPHFRLAYHNESDLELQRDAARLFRAKCPSLGGTAGPARRRRGEGPLRVGFVSDFLHEHTIGRLFAETIARLPAERFHRVVFFRERRDDAVQSALHRAVDQAIPLHGSLAEAREAIAAQHLDVLVYPDLGMSPFTYFLAFARLAPVQCVSWGHPDTTGIDTVDAFLTCAAMEPEGAQAHYTERLVPLPGLGLYYPRPRLERPPLPRKALGLPEGATLYGCPQNLFKLHPDFDPVVKAILEADPNGILALLRGLDDGEWRRLGARMEKAGVPMDRVRLVPRQNHHGFLSFLAAMDVMLDPLHYSGGNTSLEALSLGVPVVTLAGRFMRSRHTHGLYTIMGMTDCVAADAEGYVRIATRLGRAPEYRRHISARIAQAAAALFEDEGAVAAWAKALDGL